MKVKFAFKGVLLTVAVLTALTLPSCSNEEVVLDEGFAESENMLTFSMRTPSGGKVSYSRADGDVLHDAPEYAVNTLQLYEYETFEEADTIRTSLTRILSYPTGMGKNVIDLKDNGDGNYSFSIVIPADYKNRKFTYRLVANNATSNLTLGQTYQQHFNNRAASLTVAQTINVTESEAGNDTTYIAPKGDFLAALDKGIAMTGSAKVKGSDSDIIEFGKDEQKCEVTLTRIVSRIDIKYETPNLRLTKVELQGAPTRSFLFPRFNEEGKSIFAAVDKINVGLSSIHTLPEKYLKDDADHDIVELQKAFYLYERKNTEDDSAIVHLEYTVDANGTEYKGVLDVPFRRTSGDKAYIDTKRNHLYTIVLGNGDEPVAGKVTATLIVDDWNLVEIDEPITD